MGGKSVSGGEIKHHSIKIISRAILQRCVDDAVASFQKSVKSWEAPRGALLTVYNYIKHHQPVTYRDVACLMPDNNTWGRAMHANGRLEHLRKYGWIDVVGRAPPIYRRRARLYAIVNRPEHPYIEVARQLLYNRIDRLVQLAEAMPACMARRVDEAEINRTHDPERTADIITARLDGMTLEEIGAHFDISRERVRQILSKTLHLGKNKENTNAAK